MSPVGEGERGGGGGDGEGEEITGGEAKCVVTIESAGENGR